MSMLVVIFYKGMSIDLLVSRSHRQLSLIYQLRLTIRDRLSIYLPDWNEIVKRGTVDIFEIVRPILARNLEIDPDAVDLEFKFHNFIDLLVERRQQQSGSKNLLYYLEAANIYFDLSEAFELNFLTGFTASTCITVADLILLIQSNLSDSVA
jgi:hypothetical protein